MINVGIFTGYYPYTLSGTIDKIKQAGMGCVQLDLEFTDIDLRRGRITKEKAHQVRNAFRRANIPIVAISAYTNLVHPDPVKTCGKYCCGERDPRSRSSLWHAICH